MKTEFEKTNVYVYKSHISFFEKDSLEFTCVSLKDLSKGFGISDKTQYIRLAIEDATDEHLIDILSHEIESFGRLLSEALNNFKQRAHNI